MIELSEPGPIQTYNLGDVRVISLTNPPRNLINRTLVTALLDALTGYQLRWANPFDFMSQGSETIKAVQDTVPLRPGSDS